MATCTITGILESADNKPRGKVKVTFRLVTSFGTTTESYIAGSEATTGTDNTGGFEITVAVPTSGTIPYDVFIGESTAALLRANLSAAISPVDFSEVINGAFDEANVTTTNALIWASIAATTVGEGAEYATLALALTAGEKFIALLPGTYSGAVTISQSDVTIVGYGATWTAQTAANTFTLTGHRNKIVGLKILGSHTGASGTMGDTGAGTAIFNDGDYNQFVDCHIENPIGFGIIGDVRTGTVIERCRFVNVGTNAASPKFVRYCIYLPGCQQSRVINNYVTGWSQAVGLWYGANDNLIADNTFYNNLAYEGGTGTETNRSACEDYGVVGSVNYRNIWRNNYVDGTTGACFEMASELRGCQVIGNTAKNFGRGKIDGGFGSDSNAIAVQAGGGEVGIGLIVENNNVWGYGTVRNTASCYDNGQGTRWINNTFYEYRNNNTGVINIDGRGVVVEGNHFYNCGRCVYIAGNHATVSNNHIEGGLETYGGTPIYGAGGDYATIANNTLYNSTVGAGGIYLSGCVGFNISGNTCRAGSLRLDNSTNGGVIGNYFYGDTADTGGVVLYTSGTTANIHFEGNTFDAEGDVHTAVVVLANSTTKCRFVGNNVIRADNNQRLVELGASTTDNVVMNNFISRPDGNITEGFNDGGTRNSIEGNHFPGAARWQTGKTLAGNTVGTSQATIAHGLGYTPTEVRITMTSAGTVWRSAVSDGTNIYLTADSAGRTCDVWVR